MRRGTPAMVWERDREMWRTRSGKYSDYVSIGAWRCNGSLEPTREPSWGSLVQKPNLEKVNYTDTKEVRNILTAYGATPAMINAVWCAMLGRDPVAAMRAAFAWCNSFLFDQTAVVWDAATKKWRAMQRSKINHLQKRKARLKSMGVSCKKTAEEIVFIKRALTEQTKDMLDERSLFDV